MTNLRIYEILSRRQQRDISQGGYNSLTIGPPGSGKTSHLLYEASNIIEWYPNETIFWRESSKSASQFNRINKNWQIFTEEGMELRFRNLITGEKIELEYTTFSSFNELINKDTGKGLAKSHQLNVVFFKDDFKWIDLMDHLRSTVGWQSIFIDEIEDICPLNPGKQDGEERNIRNEKNIQFSNKAKSMRKGLVHIFADTQNILDLDWRFIGKMNFICYLRGARAFRSSRVKQVALDGLKTGEVWLEWENRIYGKSKFPAFPPKEPVFEVLIQ